MMKLLTAVLLNKLRTVGNQDGTKDPLVIAKFFDPCSQWTRYVTEFNEQDQLFFGFVIGFEAERGYFSLAELEQFTGKLGIGIERDLHFKPCPFSKLKEQEQLDFTY